MIINKNELTEEEKTIYNGYYCAVCKSIGKRYGQFPRLALSYDIVFLALLLSSLASKSAQIENEHCIIHPVSKKPVVKFDNAVDYAADMLLILSYQNFLDDKKDEHRIRGSAGALLLDGAYKKLQKKYPEICKGVEDGINELSELEKQRSGSLDLTAAAFGNTLIPVFAGYEVVAETGDKKQASLYYNSEVRNRILGELGSSLGKWIYVMDALDDLEKDRKSGSYNPLMYRDRGTEGLGDLLYSYLGSIASAIDLLEIQKNKGIIDNIIWNGLRARTDLLLEDSKGKDNGRSI